MSLDDFRQRLNVWGRDKVPFLFVVDFEMEHPQAWPISELKSEKILFNFNNQGNALHFVKSNNKAVQVFPVLFETFKEKFDAVMFHLKRGDSFLTNLTCQSEILFDCTLRELFFQSKARYKFWSDEGFLFFSPETFIQIADGCISTFPMKGTIDASVPNAEAEILNDAKELAEHITIVDLLRNDLGQVAQEVTAARFRYVERIDSPAKSILQVSSEIKGRLASDYLTHLGDIVVQMLPAGSVSGAPKKKTLEIIRVVEQVPRGYYTGVAGYFDGERLDSCVMIRFIEQLENRLFYRSGGGITSQSHPEKEYQEILNKIYVPIL